MGPPAGFSTGITRVTMIVFLMSLVGDLVGLLASVELLELLFCMATLHLAQREEHRAPRGITRFLTLMGFNCSAVRSKIGNCCGIFFNDDFRSRDDERVRKASWQRCSRTTKSEWKDTFLALMRAFCWSVSCPGCNGGGDTMVTLNRFNGLLLNEFTGEQNPTVAIGNNGSVEKIELEMTNPRLFARRRPPWPFFWLGEPNWSASGEMDQERRKRKAPQSYLDKQGSGLDYTSYWKTKYNEVVFHLTGTTCPRFGMLPCNEFNLHQARIILTRTGSYSLFDTPLVKSSQQFYCTRTALESYHNLFMKIKEV